MDKGNFKVLLDRYLTGESTPEEERLLLEAIDEPGCRAILESVMMEDFQAHAYEEGEMPEVYARLQNRLARHIKGGAEEEAVAQPFISGGAKLFRLTRKMVAAAAVVLFLIGAGTYFLFFSKRSSKEIAGIPSGVLKQDAAPGGNNATLTLSNGNMIVLDSVHTGTLASQGNSKVIKVDSGMLAYNQLAVSSRQLAVQYNTLSTPRGGQYQLLLPDGSRVWLNAASSIRYPTAFTGSQREVEISGEAYFEIAKNPSLPFVVKKGDMEVQVLGTHFNVNAYNDEPAIKVTLLEGSVRVIASDSLLTAHRSQLLTPGEQALLNKDGRIKLLKDVDVEEAVAWKNGKFRFDVTGIEEVMRQISRWYDLDVEYKGTVNTHFWGSISRNVKVSEVFKMLEQTGRVQFTVEGRKVIVSPEEEGTKP